MTSVQRYQIVGIECEHVQHLYIYLVTCRPMSCVEVYTCVCKFMYEMGVVEVLQEPHHSRVQVHELMSDLTVAQFCPMPAL